MTVASPPPNATMLPKALRRLYFIRFAFALAWGVTVLAAPLAGPPLAAVLALYPLVDAAAVFWQQRAERPHGTPRTSEWFNVVTSAAAAVALALTAGVSPAAALIVWGLWAVLSGVAQLVTALLRRRTGGQVPLVVSGALSMLAGSFFVISGAQGAAAVNGAGGYAILGGIFFLVAATRLSVLLRGRA